MSDDPTREYHVPDFPPNDDFEETVVASSWPGTVGFCVVMVCVTAVVLDLIPS